LPKDSKTRMSRTKSWLSRLYTTSDSSSMAVAIRITRRHVAANVAISQEEAADPRRALIVRTLSQRSEDLYRSPKELARRHLQLLLPLNNGFKCHCPHKLTLH